MDTERALHRRNALLEALHRTSIGLLDRTDPQEVLRAITERARGLVHASDAYIYLVDKERGDLVVRTAAGATPEKYVNNRLALGEGIAGRVWQSAKALLVKDYATWEGRSAKIGDDVRAVVSVPLIIRGEVVGVLGVYHREADRGFDDEDVAFLEDFARLASVALDHAQLLASAHESRALLESAFLHANIARAVTDVEGRWIRVNPAFCEMLGRTEAEMLGQRFSDMTHPDDLAENLALFQRMMRGEAPGYTLEKRFLHKDGRAVWAIANVTLVRDATGAPKYVIGDVLDLTGRKRDEAMLRDHAVTKDLVREMLQGLGRRGVESQPMMRDIGRTLARGAQRASLEDHLRAFGSMGLGELRLESAANGRYGFRGKDLLEREKDALQSTCHLPLGFLEAAVSRVEGTDALGTETTCQSMGADACRFVVGRRTR